MHYTVGDCPLGKLSSYDHGNSEKHLDLTETFYSWLKQQFPYVKIIPDYLIDKELKTDIYFELSGEKIAIEIQFKRINNPLFLKRRELYKQNNIHDIWFFVEEEGFTIGSPFHRSYYHSNDHELYFYVYPEAYVKVYKGLNRENWEDVGVDTLYESVMLSISLEQITVLKEGRLVIPNLRKLLFEKIMEIRKTNNELRLADKTKEKERKEVAILFQDRLRASQSPIFSESQKPTTNSLKEKTVIRHETYKQEYEEYHFTIEDGREYLNIKIIYKMQVYDVKYMILKRTGDKREQYLTCIKVNGAPNIKYSIEINPFLDSMKAVRIMKYEIQ